MVSAGSVTSFSMGMWATLMVVSSVVMTLVVMSPGVPW